MPNVTPRDEFRLAFLSECAGQGLDMPQVLSRVRSAREKLAALQKSSGISDLLGKLLYTPVDLAKAMGPTALGLGAVAAVGAPIAAGVFTGGAAAKAQDDDTNLDEARADELISKYRERSERLRRDMEAKKMQSQGKLSPTYLGGDAI